MNIRHLFVTAVACYTPFLASKQPMIINRTEMSPYSTHLTPLVTAVINTTGPVLEMGCGDYSTPLLHAICAKEKRLLVSVDTEKRWMNFFLDLENENHHFIYLKVYDDDRDINPQPHKWDAIGNNVHWGVVFIDHRPAERRKEDIKRLRSHTDVFVVHDTEAPLYGYEPVLKTFKYRFDYKRYQTSTAIVSDIIDVSQWFLQ